MAVKNVSDEFTACGTVLICNFNRKRSPIIYFFCGVGRTQRNIGVFISLFVCSASAPNSSLPYYSLALPYSDAWVQHSPCVEQYWRILGKGCRKPGQGCVSLCWLLLSHFSSQALGTFSVLLGPGLLEIPWLRVEKPFVWQEPHSV